MEGAGAIRSRSAQACLLALVRWATSPGLFVGGRMQLLQKRLDHGGCERLKLPGDAECNVLQTSRFTIVAVEEGLLCLGL